jgi:hypothetical protein
LTWFFLIHRVIEDGLCVYNIHYTVEKHFSISIAPVRIRGGSLVTNISNVSCAEVEKLNVCFFYYFLIWVVILTNICWFSVQNNNMTGSHNCQMFPIKYTFYREVIRIENWGYLTVLCTLTCCWLKSLTIKIKNFAMLRKIHGTNGFI